MRSENTYPRESAAKERRERTNSLSGEQIQTYKGENHRKEGDQNCRKSHRVGANVTSVKRTTNKKKGGKERKRVDVDVERAHSGEGRKWTNS